MDKSDEDHSDEHLAQGATTEMDKLDEDHNDEHLAQQSGSGQRGGEGKKAKKTLRYGCRKRLWNFWNKPKR